MREVGSGDRHAVRALELHVELLGAYHDGGIQLVYSGVRRYSLYQPFHLAGDYQAHGDWLVDEVRLSEEARPEAPLVLHEVVFSEGGHWLIEAADIAYDWLPRVDHERTAG